jgi:hypothetical protein
MELSDSRRWGWLSKRWMLPNRYRVPFLVAWFVGARLLTDSDGAFFAALAAAIPVIYLADFLWWRRHRSR